MRIDVGAIIDTRAEAPAALHQSNLQACPCEHISGDPAAGTATDNADIEDILGHLRRSTSCRLGFIVLQLEGWLQTTVMIPCFI